MKIAYITVHTPWGRGETFILEEMLALRDIGGEIIVIPRDPRGGIFHRDSRILLGEAVNLPLINCSMFLVFMTSLLLKPIIWRLFYLILRSSRTWRIFMKNIVVLPKAVYIANILKKIDVVHIHAHWGSTTATLAWVIAELNKTPWSFTLHSWDIVENNMLKVKSESARFIRCISGFGRRRFIKIVGEKIEKKAKVIHMGTKVSRLSLISGKKDKIFKVIVPANLVEIKGHRYLIEACEILVKRNTNNIRFYFYGEGPLRSQLEDIIIKKQLIKHIKILKPIPHERLMHIYEKGEADLVVLPSITTERGECEGIPVSLIEAMSYGIPVISTKTGGIPELIEDGSGVMVEEKNPYAIADAIERLITDKEFYTRISIAGRKKIEREFDIRENAQKLLKLILSFEERPQ